ncbi:MAG: hypothetical protein HY298_26305 [Verrucomicrobia bacterium]|nr:hypothetical protein [Verrucomicrobiota bacterium]
MNPIVGTMFAAFDSFWVIIAIGIGSAIYNWLQKRNAAANDQEAQPPSEPPQRGQAPTRTQPAAPRQTKSVSWEEELRRLLEGDAPAAPPPPPVFVFEKKPAPAPPPRVRPVVEHPSSAPARPLVTLTESSSASQRVEQLNKKVETHLGHVGSMAEATFAFQKASGLDVAVADRMSKVTGQHVAQAAVVKHKTDSPEVAQVVSLFRNPRTARQAMLASFILGPPKALEN